MVVLPDKQVRRFPVPDSLKLWMVRLRYSRIPPARGKSTKNA
ncbi:hypothetical protein [Candidatus Nitrososphaera gargensis]|nr:hypothetical protein [Candidatus Nitrososphaera gargensis]